MINIQKNNINNANPIKFFLSNKTYVKKYKILKTLNIKDYSVDFFLVKTFINFVKYK
jgi:hypothetical protein